MRGKLVFAVILTVLGLGAANVMEPRRSLDNRGQAPLMTPVYAPPLEQIETLELQRGQTLSQLLMKAAITGPDLSELLRALNTQQNPRSLAAGAEVTIRRWTSTGEPRIVDLALNPDTTIRIQRSGLGWTTNLAITPVVVDTVFVTGKIAAGRSLYESIAMDTAIKLPIDERIQLVSEVADIFENEIDFLHDIQPGDEYAVAYEREARPDGTSRPRTRRVLISRLVNRDSIYNAVRFDFGKSSAYYDLKGNSLQSGFRRFPLDFAVITSNFAWRRYHPILGVYRAHLGTDFGAASGTPVRATGDGTVVSAGRSGGYGNVVVIRHYNGLSTRYAHLRGFAKGIRAGARVTMNQTIGYVGATGLATAPHLHYELRKDGRAVDFKTAKLPTARPLPVAYQEEFRGLVKERLVLLEEGILSARYARRPGVTTPNAGGGL